MTLNWYMRQHGNVQTFEGFIVGDYATSQVHKVFFCRICWNNFYQLSNQRAAIQASNLILFFNDLSLSYPLCYNILKSSRKKRSSQISLNGFSHSYKCAHYTYTSTYVHTNALILHRAIDKCRGILASEMKSAESNRIQICMFQFSLSRSVFSHSKMEYIPHSKLLPSSCHRQCGTSKYT